MLELPLGLLCLLATSGGVYTGIVSIGIDLVNTVVGVVLLVTASFFWVVTVLDVVNTLKNPT